MANNCPASRIVCPSGAQDAQSEANPRGTVCAPQLARRELALKLMHRDGAIQLDRRTTMQTHSVTYGEFAIVVRPLQNVLGSWIADVCVTRGGETVVDTRPLTV